MFGIKNVAIQMRCFGSMLSPLFEAKLHILEICVEVQLHESAYAEYYFG